MSYRDGEVTIEAEEYYDLWETIAAKDAEIARLEQRISEQSDRIAELYLSQKGRIMSAKSTEYDIDQLSKQLAAKDAEIARIRDALEPFVKIMNKFQRTHYDLDHSILVDVPLGYLLDARAALEQKP